LRKRPLPRADGSTAMRDTYQVKLENVFEGPMDLLVHLIKKNEVDIYDIPIAFITDQYLRYLEWMKMMNIDFAGEFLVMAATLAQIKSRMLLPTHGNEDEEEDPRMEIARPLIEYIQMKTAAEALARRNLLGDKTFTRAVAKSEALTTGEPELARVGLFELIDAFQKILEKNTGSHVVDLTTEPLSVKERMNQLIAILEEKGSVTFDKLFDQAPSRMEIIVTFLALLELIKMNLTRVVQSMPTGIIRVFYV